MPCMTVGMVETTRRRTRFPTVGTDITTKAKPPSAATAFCIYFITLTDAINNREKAKEKPQPTSKPHPSLPKWDGEPHNLLKLSKKELQPIKEGLGRGSGCCGGGSNKQLFLYRRKPDFLNGHRPLFVPSRRMASCRA